MRTAMIPLEGDNTGVLMSVTVAAAAAADDDVLSERGIGRPFHREERRVKADEGSRNPEKLCFSVSLISTSMTWGLNRMSLILLYGAETLR